MEVGTAGRSKHTWGRVGAHTPGATLLMAPEGGKEGAGGERRVGVHTLRGVSEWAGGGKGGCRNTVLPLLLSLHYYFPRAPVLPCHTFMASPQLPHLLLLKRSPI